MKLLGRKNDDSGDAEQAEPAVTPTGATAPGHTGATAPKGKPTPKRDSGKRRGPVAPAPMTASEARQRRKAARKTMTREEKQADKLQRRTALTQRRERMMDGDEAYLLPRDKGPVRRYVRDIVDSRRSVLGLFMPISLSLIFVMLAVPQFQYYVSPAMLVVIAIMAADGILLARKVNRAVDAKFPDNTESHWKLGTYAASRASQMRRMRMPRPQASLGAKVV